MKIVEDISRNRFFANVANTRKKFVLEELPNSSETEDMRKIQYIDFTELYSKITRTVLT